MLPILIHFQASFERLCEKHLIADDPYQFEAYPIEQLITVWFDFKREGKLPPKVLVDEIRRRLNDPDTSKEHIEILTKLTGVTR